LLPGAAFSLSAAYADLETRAQNGSLDRLIILPYQSARNAGAAEANAITVCTMGRTGERRPRIMTIGEGRIVDRS